MSTENDDFDLEREFQKHLDSLACTDWDEPFPTMKEINAPLNALFNKDLEGWY